MNENYTIDVNGLSDMELDALYAQSVVSYTENFSVEFSSLSPALSSAEEVRDNKKR